MKRYSKGIKSNDHTLSDVFQAYECNRETQFVESFFGEEEMNAVIEACGLARIDKIDRDLETPISIGMATKRADLTFEDEGQLYYFEVMSQSQNGKWDNDHHEQFCLKSNRLKLDYEQVYSFAIAFKEFETPYLNEFSKMEDSYAIHLRFTDQGYFADVYGIEEKKEKVSVKLASLEELGLRWMNIASSQMGFKNRKDSPHRNRYLYIGKPFTGSRLGIEWVINQKNNDLGIKISGYLVKDHGLTKIIDETGKVIDGIKTKVPGFEFVKESTGLNDKTISFKFDNTNFSEENVKLLKDITIAFAEELGIESLVN
tara:strand:+ start:2939 stop:3880 length:942 start_codon:yes stop_codon:yes gene_type:complete